jgi:hypothetical protein
LYQEDIMTSAAPHTPAVAGIQARAHLRGQRALRLTGVLAAAAFAVAGGVGCARSAPAPAAAAAAFHSHSPAGLAIASPAPAPAASGSPTALPAASASPASPAGYTGPHFATPQQAMTYLAAAYNGDNVTELHYVTTPVAFGNLMTMRSTAINLHLSYCKLSPAGDYICYFRHDYPARLHRNGHGQAIFIAGPALDPGWYMARFADCG